ncbi:MAG: hypothetical protein ACUVSD_12650 [Thiobacillaceae bacterium]
MTKQNAAPHFSVAEKAHSIFPFRIRASPSPVTRLAPTVQIKTVHMPVRQNQVVMQPILTASSDTVEAVS